MELGPTKFLSGGRDHRRPLGDNFYGHTGTAHWSRYHHAKFQLCNSISSDYRVTCCQNAGQGHNAPWSPLWGKVVCDPCSCPYQLPCKSKRPSLIQKIQQKFKNWGLRTPIGVKLGSRQAPMDTQGRLSLRPFISFFNSNHRPTMHLSKIQNPPPKKKKRERNINYCVRGGHKPARWPWPTSRLTEMEK